MSGYKMGAGRGVPVVARLMRLSKIMVFGEVPLLDIDIADCKVDPSVTLNVAAFKMEQEVKQIVALNKFRQDIFRPF